MRASNEAEQRSKKKGAQSLMHDPPLISRRRGQRKSARGRLALLHLKPTQHAVKPRCGDCCSVFYCLYVTAADRARTSPSLGLGAASAKDLARLEDTEFDGDGTAFVLVCRSPERAGHGRETVGAVA